MAKGPLKLTINFLKARVRNYLDLRHFPSTIVLHEHVPDGHLDQGLRFIEVLTECELGLPDNSYLV